MWWFHILYLVLITKSQVESYVRNILLDFLHPSLQEHLTIFCGYKSTFIIDYLEIVIKLYCYPSQNFSVPEDLSAYDGIEMRVKGDGRRYKFIIRTSTDWDTVGYTASFDTEDGPWQTVGYAATWLTSILYIITSSHFICTLFSDKNTFLFITACISCSDQGRYSTLWSKPSYFTSSMLLQFFSFPNYFPLGFLLSHISF